MYPDYLVLQKTLSHMEIRILTVNFVKKCGPAHKVKELEVFERE